MVVFCYFSCFLQLRRNVSLSFFKKEYYLYSIYYADEKVKSLRTIVKIKWILLPWASNKIEKKKEKEKEKENKENKKKKYKYKGYK